MYVIKDEKGETVAICSRQEDAKAFTVIDKEPERYYEWMLWKLRREDGKS